MVRLTESIKVSPPIGAAFSYVADFANVAEWDPGIARARQLTTSELGPGTRFEVVARFAGRDVPMHYTITEWEPPYRVVLEGKGDALTAVDTIRFEPHAGGTHIHYMADLSFKGLLSFAEPLLRGRLVRMGRHALEGLERTLNGVHPMAGHDPTVSAAEATRAEAA